MAEETISIFRIDTGEAVKNVAELKDNIRMLKEDLAVLEKTQSDSQEEWERYQDTLKQLKTNQNALKDVMYATSGTFEDVAASAKGMSSSYNSLVHRMADLKSEFRATIDEAKRNELGLKIKEINDQLKEMDALQGNFQRNVGNYESAFKGMAKYTDAMDKGFKAMNGGLGNIKNGFEALAISPAIGTFSILVTAAFKLADSLKDNETAMAGLKKGMDALKPVMDFFSGILENVASVLADIISDVAEFATSNGLFQKIISGVMGIGNAVLQYVIAPFKGIVKAIGVLRDEGVKGLKNAAKAFGEEMKSGISFKKNFESGQTMADTIIKGARDKKDKMNEAGKELGKDLGKGIEEGFKLADPLKILDEVEKKADQKRKEMLEALKEYNSDVESEWADLNAEIDGYVAEQGEMMLQQYKNEESLKNGRIAMMYDTADATSSILSSIADMYEADEESSVENAKRIKALRIASATIDTISGAIKAYMSAGNPILGAINASVVSAAGMANIAKIRSTNISTDSTSSSGTTFTTTTASAPSVQTEVSNVRNVTSASEEERLNQMADKKQVYILASDIEASQTQIKTQVAESSY